MRILLTGAGGKLGQALQEALTDHDLIALDHHRLDITQFDAVRTVVQAYRPDVVLNAAAFNNVDDAESNLHAAYRGNALGPRNLAIVTAAHRLPLLHMSTDYVFDGTSTRPYHEFDRPHPLSVYGASKLAGEEAVRTLNRRHYLVRTAWLYHTVGRNFPKTVCALADQPEVRVVSDQFGSPTYAPHLAAVLACLITTEAYGTYHLAGQGEASWYELTCVLYRNLGLRTTVRPVARSEFPQLAERPRYSVLTTLQEPRLLLPPWEDGVAEFARVIREGRVRLN